MNTKNKSFLKWLHIRFLLSKGFLSFIIDNFFKDDCTYCASALTFTSLLAIVPLMSVSFAVLSAFPVFNDMQGPIQNFIFENFVPATGKIIQQYLQSFTSQVSNLSIWGVAFLFITSVLVMVTIEQAMNRIWKVRVPRHGTSAFLLYWTILSLTPVLMGLSIAASSYLMTLPFLNKSETFNVSLLLRLAPFLLSLSGFTFLYIVVPNCKVKFLHGFTGALIAALFFETAKMGFSWYLARYHTYELLYGAFATVPIFFLWIYWVWVIVLIGAEVAYALSTHHHRRLGTAVDGFTHAYHWLYFFWQAQQKGESISLEELINKDNCAYAVKPENILDYFLKAQLISPTTHGRFMLSRSLSQMQFCDVLDSMPFKLPDWQNLNNGPINKNLIKLLKNADEKTNAIFTTKMTDLFTE